MTISSAQQSAAPEPNRRAPYEAPPDAAHPEVDTSGESGAAYVFESSAGVYSERAMLKASNADPGDRFGQLLDVDSARIVVTAYHEQGAGHGPGADPRSNSGLPWGAAYVFDGSSLAELAYLKGSNSLEAATLSVTLSV